MTEPVEQQMCIRYGVRFEHSYMETIWMIQKASAMGNWWLAALSQQGTLSCITSHAEFFGKTSNHPGDSAPLQPRFGALWLLAFPKTKVTFEREEISDRKWDSGKYDGAADSNWKNCVRSQGAYSERDWVVIALCPVFLVSCIFFNKCLYFSYYMAGYLLDRPCTASNSPIKKQYMINNSLLHMFPLKCKFSVELNKKMWNDMLYGKYIDTCP